MPTISDRAASPIAAAPSGRVASSSLPPPPPPPPPPSAEVAANDPYAQPAGSPIIDQPGAGAPSSSAPTQTASAAPVTRESLVGAWKVTSGGGSCQIFMALTKWTGGYRAASRGCPGQVADVAAWDVSGSQVVLKDSGGTTVATLNSSGGTRYDGSTSAGQAISLYR
ncbi:protease inhibitor Inh/omp19 family protein [Mangrovibrevibacter kandeliae]|uniref:protease inhibitor Inh/omp19 family protein n=1 Tax=Mangrovibrevibacter kandeliae TaxID=2968473 RepID=UPI002117EF8C|nr:MULTISPECIES: protease inhibitor Inh/omp19 family protein [unclassified Aurantimonas]MCQ8783562.1 protease inhibitor Inh/omp19 family protein [Aurantimonas sp. CSK15Z-1]MCW4116478.1 protease inhibitor Inh/omp19 family protein [Aurantimonas sp. MSK8Z-1]